MDEDIEDHVARRRANKAEYMDSTDEEEDDGDDDEGSPSNDDNNNLARSPSPNLASKRRRAPEDADIDELLRIVCKMHLKIFFLISYFNSQNTYLLLYRT